MKDYDLDNIAPWNNIEMQLFVIEERVLSSGNFKLFYQCGLRPKSIPTSIKAIGTFSSRAVHV